VARAKALYALAGLPPLVPALVEEALAIARALGDRQLIAWGLVPLAMEAVDAGDDDRAARLIAEAEACREEIRDLDPSANLRVQRGILARRRGDLAQATADFSDALPLARRAGNDYMTALALELLGGVLTERGEYGLAAARFRDALASWRVVGTQEGLVDWLALVASLAAAVGDPERAARWFAVVEAQVEVVGGFFWPLPEQARFGRIAADVRAALGEAAAGTAWAAGRALPPEQATAEAETLLAALVAPTAAVAPTDPAVRAGLTPREREVLRLLAAGRSNREIADALFVGVPTVKVHVRNILGKLGAASRTAAAAVAIREGLA
jgi:ATP/maltotriose-dependent transcriptional regulator MalT